MKTKSPFFLSLTGLAALFTLVSFSLSKNIKTKDHKKEVPPGCVKISENFFCDQEEVSNFSYLEYMYWTKRVYGEASKQYIDAAPDQNVWNVLPCGRKHMILYFSHPKYRDYPVVGITYEQAVNFTKWRSNRVMEFVLIREGYMDHVPNPDSLSCFSIEKYYSGEYKVKNQKKPTYPYYPEYRLPTVAEWKKISVLSDSLFMTTLPKEGKTPKYSAEDFEKHVNCSFLKNINSYCYRDSMVKEPIRKSATTKRGAYVKIKWLVNNIRGNVSELSATKGVSLGGSWNTPSAIIEKQDTFHYKKSDIYTGFRNVCAWKEWPRK